jgi:hypothetical protein
MDFDGEKLEQVVLALFQMNLSELGEQSATHECKPDEI